VRSADRRVSNHEAKVQTCILRDALAPLVLLRMRIKSETHVIARIVEGPA
jgi:hypothetical protein